MFSEILFAEKFILYIKILLNDVFEKKKKKDQLILTLWEFWKSHFILFCIISITFSWKKLEGGNAVLISYKMSNINLYL